MSNIEKALEKSKKEINKIEERTLTPESDDTIQSDAHDKGVAGQSPSQKKSGLDDEASMLDYLNIHNLESSSESKLDKSDSHIISAVEKKDNKSVTKHRLLIDNDFNQLMGDGGLISQIQDTDSGEQKTKSVTPATTVDNYDVEEHIVSYYESIGKQTWEGPVMVNFRRLQVSIKGLQKNNMCKVMVFTSSQQKEGKSTISLNTAITLCSDKKSNIAIVDCDFRKPTLNKFLGFSPDKGLSDYLLEEAEIKDILHGGIIPNLTIIPVGNKPSNTCELFASDRMTQFVSYLREQFDCVIIDTPPVLAFPDTVIIAPLSDGVIFVINCKSTRKTIVKRAVETLKDCKVIGFIMNMSESAAVDYYGYTSGYYYYDYASS